MNGYYTVGYFKKKLQNLLFIKIVSIINNYSDKYNLNDNEHHCIIFYSILIHDWVSKHAWSGLNNRWKSLTMVNQTSKLA